MLNPLKIYDSLSNQYLKIVGDTISIYNCGPTVYNDIHIGNARPLITFDVLNRLLNVRKCHVTYIHNITDIDDKIIAKAKELKKTEKEIAAIYGEHYLEINKALNIQPIEMMPKVSDHVYDIINYIQRLIDKKAAYAVDGDVYFDISSVSNYGVLSHQNIDALYEGVRKENNANKKSPLDFVLWKKTETGLNWKSPWSTGRPGWHTECATFINKYVGDHVTIHGGGIDLKFPHHENENAQNFALFNRNIADVWMHVGHINVNDEKMAKSSGNFILVKDLLDKYSGNDIRWLMYQSQYQNPINFSFDLLNQAAHDFRKLTQQINNGYVQMILNGFASEPARAKIDDEFINTLSEDLNFPNTIALLWKHAKELAKPIRSQDFEKFLQMAANLQSMLDILGLNYLSPTQDTGVRSIVEEWKKALQEKNYILADKYRQMLIDNGVI